MTPAEAGRILGISPKADMEQIKKQYRRLMHQFHPMYPGFQIPDTSTPPRRSIWPMKF